MARRSLLLILLTLILFHVHGQTDIFRKQYTEGKEYFDMGKYNLAMETFKSLTLETNKTSFAPYSAFFYALSAYKAGYNYLAKDMFIQLVEKFPDWENTDEGRLWLCKLYFGEGSYSKAISISEQIKSEEIAEGASHLIKSVLSEELDYYELADLQNNFPENQHIAEILALEIANQPFYQQDRALLDHLINQFHLDPGKYNLQKIGPSVKKESYNIAVLFPFMHHNIIPNRVKRNNQFVLDMYQGVLTAASDLKEEGIDMNVYGYDTWRNGDTTEMILATEEMKSMDLLIGPLYPESVKKCAEFTYKNGIIMFNPLSTNSALIGNNPFSFLYYPILERQAKTAAEFVSKRVDNKNTFIFYGTSLKDSILAHHYRAEIEKDSFDINVFQKITGLDTINIFDILTDQYSLKDLMEEDEYDSLISSIPEDSVFQTEFFVIEPDSIGHVYVASSKELLGSEVMSGVETRGDTILIIGNDDWLNFKSISLDQYNRIDIALIATSFVDNDKPDVELVNETIMSVTHSPPTRYHYIGYELLCFTGHMLHKYGNLFQHGLKDEGLVKGKIFPGFNYVESNDNSVVPIIEFIVDEFMITNSNFNDIDINNE